MKQWLLTCSRDAVDIDYSEIITSDEEPGFWDQYEIAERHGCPWFCCEQL